MTFETELHLLCFYPRTSFFKTGILDMIATKTKEAKVEQKNTINISNNEELTL